MYCPNTECSGKLCLHKKTFQILGRSGYQCPQCASVCQVRNIPFDDQINSLLLSCGRGVHTFEESPKSIEDVIGDVYCSGKYSFNRGMRISWRLSNNSEIHLWLWKVWSLVVCSQSSFYVTRARKDNKTGKPCLIFAEKRNLVPNKQLLLNVPLESSKHREKGLCVDNKVKETIGDVFCRTCRNDKCVYI